MKEKLLEDKNKIINIMLNLNKKKEETIISKNKNLPLKRRADEEPEESQNIKYENFDYKIKILGMLKNIIIKLAKIILNILI